MAHLCPESDALACHIAVASQNSIAADSIGSTGLDTLTLIRHGTGSSGHLRSFGSLQQIWQFAGHKIWMDLVLWA